MEIKTQLIGAGTPARPGIGISNPIGITIHETGNTSFGAGAFNHMMYQTVNGGQNQEVSYHWVVDDHEAYNLVPEDEVTWHAGDGRGNGNMRTISIEMCVNIDSDFEQTIKNTFELIAMIRSRHGNLPLYRHYDWSGKNCPQNIIAGNPMNWDTFLSLANGVTPKPTEPTGKSTEQIAQEVIAGAWGNGDERRARLEAAGYDYNTIQNYVNALYVNEVPVQKPTSKSASDIAQEVIAGAWGNGDERRARLEAAGYSYDEVQSIVNASFGQAPTPQKSLEQIADEVIYGSWGNGDARRYNLEAAGYSYQAVQDIVNRKLS
ncbi:MAG: N-acetylmuramoyl-L-alanine amidase [Lachnospiraceae bacterium]|nr:N-acetylmuramoyl-L-alanine amidase [Lachnospiraceae bacterium]